MILPFVIQTIRDQQLRGIEVDGAAAPVFTIWDPDVPDARPKLRRGGIVHKRYGPMNRMYCVACHRKAPYMVSDSILKTLYKCPRCVRKDGPVGNSVLVPGTETA